MAERSVRFNFDAADLTDHVTNVALISSTPRRADDADLEPSLERLHDLVASLRSFAGPALAGPLHAATQDVTAAASELRLAHNELLRENDALRSAAAGAMDRIRGTRLPFDDMERLQTLTRSELAQATGILADRYDRTREMLASVRDELSTRPTNAALIRAQNEVKALRSTILGWAAHGKISNRTARAAIARADKGSDQDF